MSPYPIMSGNIKINERRFTIIKNEFFLMFKPIYGTNLILRVSWTRGVPAVPDLPHGPHGPPQRDKTQKTKKMYATESENFYFSTLRPSREKSAYTTGVYFGTVFRPNAPIFCGSLRSPERGISCCVGVMHPSRKKFIDPCLTSLQFTALVYYLLL